ncbi:hypothetical protein M3Y99_01448500 [Aphelenchoides fujianensis]|nr:hypothetical protein M3Y99_01448500 [Aphelenchoides fujianensis]
MENTPIYVTTIEDGDIGSRLKDSAKHPLHVRTAEDADIAAKKFRGQKVNRYNLSWIFALLTDLALIFVSLHAEEPLISFIVVTPAATFVILLSCLLILLCHQRTAAVIFLFFSVPIMVAHLILGIGILAYGCDWFQWEWLAEHVSQTSAVRIGVMHFLPVPFLLMTTIAFARVAAGAAAHEVGMIKPPPYFSKNRGRVCVVCVK